MRRDRKGTTIFWYAVGLDCSGPEVNIKVLYFRLFYSKTEEAKSASVQ